MNDSKQTNRAATQIKLIRKYLKFKIMEDSVSFRGHDQEWQNVYNLVKKTVVDGESNSALIIGPSGSGKTTLINSVLYQLSKEFVLDHYAVIIRLNGLVHLDERIALKSVIKQLEDVQGHGTLRTADEHLSFLLRCLMLCYDHRSRSMVFVLEHCDGFCKSGLNQSFLYNLFDATQSRIAPMCVIGITSRLDITELFEKRIKSRFSQRYIFMFPNELSDVQSPLLARKQNLIDMLSVPESLAGRQTEVKKRQKKASGMLKEKIEGIMGTDLDDTLSQEVLKKCYTNLMEFRNLDKSFIQDWNSHVKSFENNDDVTNSLEKLCYYTEDEQIFRNILFQIVCKLSPSKPFIEPQDIVSIIDNTMTLEHRVKLLQSLSVLELSLIIAMKHCVDIFDRQPMNFEMVLNRYRKITFDHSSVQIVPRAVILKAFENLQDLELIMPVRTLDSSAADTTASRVQKEYKLYTLAVNVQDIDQAVNGFKALPTEIKHWYSNPIM